tara:strand:+ start:351 stop:659 length:309 start_codon:yes stop_codon:yes gene_type:complete
MKDFKLSSEDIDDFLENKKWLIHSLIIKGIKKCMDEGLDEIIIFRIINLSEDYLMTTTLKKVEWVNSLNKCLEFYKGIEEYEKCLEIQKLLKKIEDGNTKTN